jgi:FSR family fosmidomycin resistance protein-like MFS transporter
MEAIEVAPELKAGRNKLAATVVLGHAIKHVYNSGMQSIILPEIKISMALNATQFGTLAFSRQAVGWGVTMGAGYLGDRFAHRAPLLLGISLSAMGVAFFLAGLAPTYWWMFAAMLLIGIGPSLYHPPAIGALSRRFPDKRGFAISLHGTGGSVGQVIGPLVTAGALAFLVWQDVLKVSLFPALLAAFMIWSMMRGVTGAVPGSSSTRAYIGSLALLLKKRMIFALVLVTALRSMGQGAVTVFLPVYLKEDLEFSSFKVAIYLSMAQVVGIAAQPVMGFLSDRLGRKFVLVPAMAILGALFIVLRFADPGVQLIVTVLAMGAFLYSLHTIFIAAAMDVAGGEVQSTVVSLIYGAGFLGTASPILAGVIADSSGDTRDTFLFGGAVVLLAAVILLLLKLPKTASQAAESPGH